MGISQLLPLLEKSTRACNISEFRGRTVAVDSYCWLHKGARSCAMQLAKGEDTDMYVIYCMKYVKMLLHYDIKPIMVFDGRHLPAKLGTEEKRRNAKKLARKQGMEYLRLGQSTEAYKYFCQCVDVTPEMALALIKECRKLQVDCIVAPYESDAQLAFFALKGIADCVISEDSDLLLFGCQKVLYKMDQNGNGQLIEADKLYLSMMVKKEAYTFDKFRHMCILSGCDYLDSLPGIGLKKALKFITMTAETNPALFLDKVPRYLNMRNLTVTDEYKQNFFTADATFQHQIVFDPFQKKLVPLNPIETKLEYCKNAGEMFDQKQAFQIALGNLNPITLEKIGDWQPGNSIISEYSIWSPNFKHRPLKSEKKPAKLNRPKVVLDSTMMDVDNSKNMEQLEKELEFYGHKQTVEVEIHNQPTVSTKPDAEISPVIGSNPFLRKKTSKFQMTRLKSTQKVLSRFFTSPDLSVPEEVQKTELNNSLPLIPPDGSEERDLGLTSVDEGCDVESDNSSLKFNSDDSLPLVECECILEVDDVLLETEPAAMLASVENLSPQDISRKRKSQNEPKENKRGAKKQLTIRDMFNKLKMN